MSGSATFGIPLRHQKQQEKYDCWATCLAIICDWKGVALSRSQIWNQAAFDYPDYAGSGFSGMLSLPEANKLVKKLSGDRISFDRYGKAIFTWDVYKSYLNQFRPILVCMYNHCWIVSGYGPDSEKRLLIHNVAKHSGPEEASCSVLNNKVVDSLVFSLPAAAAPSRSLGEVD